MKNKNYLILLTAFIFVFFFTLNRTSAQSGISLSALHQKNMTASQDTAEQIILSEGQAAPLFVLPDQNNTKHSIKEYRGKWVVLYFYPKDMTPGCTTEACNFRDSFSSFEDRGAVILGVSKDNIKSHLEFSGKYQLPFTLLSDEQGTVCEDYGVWIKKTVRGKTFMGINRSTFLIDPEGKIAKIYTPVDVDSHIQEVLEDIKLLSE